MKVSFVVLHYCQIKVTLECVKSLLHLKGTPFVVIVDNASPDGSGKLLEEKFRGLDNVHVILNDRNLGFASANNIGYSYAKTVIGADIIAVINNDTIIEDLDFLEKLKESCYLREYHIIAPDIINLEGSHQNPFATRPLSCDECVRNYRKLSILQLLYSIPIIGDIKIKLKKQFPSQIKGYESEVKEMVIPHGAAIIYTPQWIEKEDIAFCPGTFLYLEEELLFYYAIRHQYKTIYVPDLQITHLEDISTNARFKSNRKKSLFQCKQMKKSYKVLISFIKEK